MLITEPSWFEVVGQQNGNLWLQVQTGRDQGRRVSVPTFRDGDAVDQLESLSVGDRCKVVLRSESETAPDWRVEEIQEIEKRPQQRPQSGPTSSGLSD